MEPVTGVLSPRRASHNAASLHGPPTIPPLREEGQTHRLRRLLLTLYRRGVLLARWARLGRLPLAVALHERVISRWLPEVIEFRGQRLRLDPRDGCGLVAAELHTRELEFLLRQVRPGDVVVDVGANVGLYTVFLAHAVGPSGHVYAFEPEPRNFDLLCQNVALNRLSQVTTVNQAVSDRTGKAVLHLSKTHGALHRMHPSRLCRQTLEVDCVRLDDFFNDPRQRVNLVKLDIEGHEYHALRGMQRVLSACPQLGVFMEFGAPWLAEAGVAPVDVFAFLDAQGFGTQEVRDDGQASGFVGSESAQSLRVARRITNLWCVRRTGLPSTIPAPESTLSPFFW